MTETVRAGEGGGAPPPPPPPRDLAAAELARFASYLVVLAAAAGLYVVAMGLPTSRWEPLGAGAFPRLVLMLLGLLCVAALVDSGRRLARLGMPDRLGGRLRDMAVAHRLVIYVFLAFVAYLLLLKPVGFALSTFLFLVVAQLLAAGRGWRNLVIAVVVALVFSFGLNLLFAEVFMVFLPRGFLG